MYFNEDGNVVSDKHIKLGGKTYSIENISYVNVTKISPKLGCLITLSIFSVIFLIYCFDSGDRSALLFSLPITCGLIYWTITKKSYFVIKLGLGMGEVHAFKSKDKILVDRLHNAIKAALGGD
jgi:hypothetical protein